MFTKQMELSQLITGLFNSLRDIVDDFNKQKVYSGLARHGKLPGILQYLGPVLIVVIFYQYLKHALIFNASVYEASEKKRNEYLKKLAKQLRLLAKRYGNFYFCYMPMTHGTSLPPTYSLSMAIKEVLIKANRPGTRALRTNLLFDLIHGDHEPTRDLKYMDSIDLDLFNTSSDVTDALCEFNLDIMKCSRELIIQGVKDFDVMSTIYRVLETVLEGSEE